MDKMEIIKCRKCKLAFTRRMYDKPITDDDRTCDSCKDIEKRDPNNYTPLLQKK